MAPRTHNTRCRRVFLWLRTESTFRRGLFSQTSRAMKEATGTYENKLGGGFDGSLEFRHDWNNRPHSQTNQAGSP